jgi:hypothetical protein
MDLNDISYDNLVWIELSQDRILKRTLNTSWNSTEHEHDTKHNRTRTKTKERCDMRGYENSQSGLLVPSQDSNRVTPECVSGT